VNMICLAEKTS